MAWTCCGGSGSCGRSRCPGTRRRGAKPETSPVGCRSPTSRPGRTGGIGWRRLLGAVDHRDEGLCGPNPVTGRAAPGRNYGAATRAHSESVLRHFYDFHLEVGTGPMVNPFPLARGRDGQRPRAHHNPMEPHGAHPNRAVPAELARRVPRMHPRRQVQRAVRRVCPVTVTGHWLRSGSRPALGRPSCWAPTRGDADPGRQLITVVRKGTRALQQIPASPTPSCGSGSTTPRSTTLWCGGRTSRCGGRFDVRCGRSPTTPPGPCSSGPTPPWAATGPCTIFVIALPIGWPATPRCPSTDVQWVLGHAHLSTTQLYVTAPLGRCDRFRPRPPSPPARASSTGPSRRRRRATGPRPWTCCSEGPKP